MVATRDDLSREPQTLVSGTLNTSLNRKWQGGRIMEDKSRRHLISTWEALKKHQKSIWQHMEITYLVEVAERRRPCRLMFLCNQNILQKMCLAFSKYKFLPYRRRACSRDESRRPNKRLRNITQKEPLRSLSL